jgi:hypothetical protein
MMTPQDRRGQPKGTVIVRLLVETQGEIEGLMKTIDFNKHECIKNLRLYRDKMEKILSLVEDKLPLCGADKERVQLLLKDLKQDLKTDLDRSSTGRWQKQMGSIEQDFYMPAIHEAAKRISVGTYSKPSQRWIDEIDNAQKYIKYYLNQLLS